VAQDLDEQQRALWNGAAGEAWVSEQPLLDRMFAPFVPWLEDVVPQGADIRVLDVGCGTGSTTLTLARRLGARGMCIGVDISQPMIALARERAAQGSVRAEFIDASAQDYAFEPSAFDVIVSRFGVMFFAEPVTAFANLRRASRDGALGRWIVWRSAAENPFMTAAEHAARPLLPDLPPRLPGAPGQFAFADDAHVRGVLEASGWTVADMQPIDVACTFPRRDLESYLTRLGPVGVALTQVDEQTRSRILDTLIPAFDRYVEGDDVSFTAACWLIDARARAR
jgi:SAM-dependent methyltransferase